ncbi:hypothetical protein [Pseudoalteromonas phenolica]|uniref:hypothetical protein n=1 Tax=Pseudoalteromonas phenolica TaxID=161398 RepID=UPI000FFEFF08|nr:hypothetical protein [Pseudoalteromonas phenolica]
MAEIIQRVRPEVLLLAEFDYVADGSAVKALIKNYLNVSQNGVKGIDYPYFYLAESNTGIVTEFDLNNDGKAGVGGGDAYGFGVFPGQYAWCCYRSIQSSLMKCAPFKSFYGKTCLMSRCQ